MLDVAQRFGLPEPEVNAWIRERFLVDFLWRDATLIVETDGGEVHGTAHGAPRRRTPRPRAAARGLPRAADA